MKTKQKTIGLTKIKNIKKWQSQPASATLRNIFEKDLLRRQKIELFPRPSVDFLPDFSNFPF
ncbi:MAG: hypothetical protein H9802_13195, partial [Candidatus Phocaeicola faecipullorum]|nr:hypothetical protein [Candidatus Phocaeicola faecipullorum]